jgi:hypothetical protein
MANEIDDFLSSLNSWVQAETTRLAEELTFARLVHTARSSVEALAEAVRQEVEDRVADELEIE